jgi:sugar phosphate isomerase/epimerase
MSKHKISARLGCYGSFAMYGYEHAHQVGIEYLEIDISNNPALLKDMMEDEETQFNIGSFIFPITTDDPNIYDRFRTACENAKQFDYGYFFSSTNSKGNFEKHREEGYKVLHKLGDIAESYGTYISMETHPPYCMNAKQMVQTMKGTDHPCVRINFDTANIYYYNQLKPGEGIDQMQEVIDYIGSFHLKESNGKPKDWFFPALGHPGGIVDFKRIFEIMDARSFDKYYTLEIEGIGSEDQKGLTLDLAKQRIIDSVNYLKKIGAM